MSKIYPCKEKITEHERLQLIGLLVIAKRHNDALTEIGLAIKEILGTKEDGHCLDAIYCNYSVEELLEKMEVVVEPHKPTETP